MSGFLPGLRTRAAAAERTLVLPGASRSTLALVLAASISLPGCDDPAGMEAPRSIWSTALPGRSPFSRMGSGEGAFYLAFGDSVFGIGAEQGNIVWRAASPSEYEPANLTYSEGVVLGAAAHAFALDARSGAARWSEPLPALAAISTSDARGGLFVVATSAARVHAFDAQTGNPAWDEPVGIDSEFDVIPRTVRIIDDVVYVGGIRNYNQEGGRTGGWLLALSVADGERRWLTEIGNAEGFHSVHDGPVPADGRLLISDFFANTTHAIDPIDGSVAWSRQGLYPAVGAAQAPLVNSAVAYVASGDAHLYALDHASGAVRWRVPMQESLRAAVLCGSSLVVGGFAVSAHDPDSGVLRDWLIAHGAERHALGTPVVFDDVLAVPVDEGIRAFRCN